MDFVQIGFGCIVSAQRLIAIVSPDSSPIKRMVQEARERGTLIDASYGRKTKSVLMMDNDCVILSSIQLDTLVERFSLQPDTQREEGDNS